MQIRMKPAGRWGKIPVVLFLVLLGLVLPAGWAQEPDANTTAGTPAQMPASTEPYHLPPAKLAQAIALNRAQLMLHFGEELWEPAFLCLLLVTGTATRLGRWMEGKTRKGWLQACCYSAILATTIFLIVDAPAGAIAHALSLHYGISIEDWDSWLLDEAKMLGLIVLLEAPLLTLVFGLLHWSPRRYWLWFAAAAIPVMLLTTFLLPPLIEPMFYDFQPLAESHPALVKQLERVVVRTGTRIPPERMFLMKASEKSNGLNAYVSGLGASKRIVVWDTTADRMPTDEILFTFAHETGHYVLNHIAKGLTLAAIGMFALFWIVARLAEWLVRRFGNAWRVSTIASLPGLAALLLALSCVQIFTEPIESSISRHFEHEADVYGQEAIHGLVPDPQKTAVASFNQLGEAYLDDPNPNPFVEFWSYDHPSTQSRAKFAAQYDPWSAGRSPRFFPK
jgi:STE24 endopeptidase